MRGVCVAIILNIVCARAVWSQIRMADARLQIELFASAPDIVQPVNAVVDHEGRLIVIENHSHFRPEDYVGPQNDRIQRLEDTDGNGVADRFTTLFEGEKDCMDLAVHPDGTLYLATRRKILRLTAKSGTHEHTARSIIELETEGDYPHNGLSGLAFDFHGNLYFGFGENLGEPYVLVDAAGQRLSGHAEGGSVYVCGADGQGLRRVATGFWNPFGQCVDVYGNLFAVDNDPDSSPPCRLLHVVERGNYGYQFRYGRSGKHPLQTWEGRLPGTLPMVAGTGEAPCEVLPYDHVTLPEDYHGKLLVSSWGDHRIERYALQRNGASYSASLKLVAQGDASFWPVGLAVAADGSVFVTDWGSRSYPLHGQGKVWRISAKQPLKIEDDLRVRRRRESFFRELAKEGSHARLAPYASDPRAEVRATFASAASLAGQLDTLRDVAREDESIDVRALAVRELIRAGASVNEFAASDAPARVRSVALTALEPDALHLTLSALGEGDAFVRSGAIASLVRNRCRKQDSSPIRPHDLLHFDVDATLDQRLLGLVLAYEQLNNDDLRRTIPLLLNGAHEPVRLAAARWCADQQLTQFVPAIREAIELPADDFRVTLGLIAALSHIQGETFDGEAAVARLVSLALHEDLSSQSRIMALRGIPPGRLSAAQIQDLSDASITAERVDLDFVREFVYTLANDPRPIAGEKLRLVARGEKLPGALQADAFVAMASGGHLSVDSLLDTAHQGDQSLSETAWQLLVGRELSPKQQQRLGAHPAVEVRDRVVHRLQEPTKETDIDSVVRDVSVLTGRADAGRRIFFNKRLVQCANCHTVSNRGAAVGPDLTKVGQANSRRELLTSIIDPSQRIAPQYVAWSIVTKDGRAQTGYLLSSKNLEETFVDAAGGTFTVHQEEIEDRRASDTSVMPERLIDHLTNQEIADLLAFLKDG